MFGLASCSDSGDSDSPVTADEKGGGERLSVSANWDAANGVKYSDGTLTGTNATWTWATSGATMNDKDKYIVQIGSGTSLKKCCYT